LFIKVLSPFRLLCVITALIIGASACSVRKVETVSGDVRPGPRLQNAFTLPAQINPPETIRSVSLSQGSEGRAPIIQMGSGQRLTLLFDEIASETSLFRVTFTHHNADWSESSLLPIFFLQGFPEDYIHGGEPGQFQTPMHFSYRYTFPNDNIRPLTSGNYLMHIHNQETNRKLFSVPFFVFEGVGEVISSLEELYNQSDRVMRHHQPFARYKYDDPSAIPQIDFSVYFVQNQFWAKARKADQQDFSEDGIARMYLSRNKAFEGTFEFINLGLGRLDEYSMQIVEYRQDISVPRVTLDRDVVNLSLSPFIRRSTSLSSPRRDRNARYALVRFQLEVPPNERTTNPIYVVGGFNNWQILDNNRLRLDSSTGVYTGQALVKEGQYAYKYVTVDGQRVNDVYFDASFASTRQEYHTLVYKRDQTFQFDRLLEIESLFSE